MPRTENIHWMETKCVSHNVYKELNNAELFVVQAKESVNEERWEDSEADIDNAIQILQSAKEKVIAVREKHGDPEH